MSRYRLVARGMFADLDAAGLAAAIADVAALRKLPTADIEAFLHAHCSGRRGNVVQLHGYTFRKVACND